MASELSVLQDQIPAIQAKSADLRRESAALVVAEPSHLPAAQELLKRSQSLGAWIEDQRKAAVRPLIDRKEEIDAMAKELAAPVEASKAEIKAKITEYSDRMERLRRQREEAERAAQRAIAAATVESQVDAALAAVPFDSPSLTLLATQRKNALAQARELEAEAKRQAEERARLAEVARQQGAAQAAIEAERAKLDEQRRAAAAQAEREAAKEREAAQAKEAEQAARRAAALAAVQKPKGVRKITLFEVTDETLLGRRYLCADLKAIKAAVDAGERDIAGVRIWEQTDVR